MTVALIVLVAIIAFGAGYAVCLVATWLRVHQQESHLRALASGIRLQQDMGDEVPPEWVLAELESMIAKDYR